MQAFSVYAVARFFGGLIEKLDRVDKISRRGFSTDFIQDLGLQAQKAGSDIEALLPKISALWRELNSASGPSKAVEENLAALGLTVADLKGLTQEELFRKVIAGLRESKDRSAALAAAMVLLRDRTGELSLVLADLADNGLAKANRASSNAVKSAAMLKDAWAEVSNFLVSVFAPVLTWLVTAFALVGTGAKIAFGIIFAGLELLGRAFVRFQKIAFMALKLDFTGAKKEIDGLVKDVQFAGATMGGVIENANLDLEAFYARLNAPAASGQPPAIPPTSPEAGPTAAAMKLPSVTASSLQRIGGGGESFVAMQRNKEIEQLQIIARASERTARATEAFDMEMR